MKVRPELIALVQAGENATGSHAGHGRVPSNLLGSFVVAAAVAVVLLVVVLCVKYFVAPGETSQGHIKRRILK